MPAEDKENLKDLSDSKPRSGESSRINGPAAFLTVVILVGSIVGLMSISYFTQDCRGIEYVPDDPCGDQAPPECIADTVEQASSSQFIHYVYCGCVTVDGIALGYVAADAQMSKGRSEIFKHGRQNED